MAVNLGQTVDGTLTVGRNLLAAREYAKAVQCHRLIAFRFPLDARAYVGLGQSFRGQGNLGKMRRAYRRALVLQPDAVESYYNFGNAERSFDEAEAAGVLYNWAVRIDPKRPEITTGWSLALLQSGDWSAAWSRYEQRESCRQFSDQMRALGREIWDGSLTPSQRVLLIAEQGAGDAIQFIRYAQFMTEAGMIVQVHCPPALERLFAAVPWIHEVSTTIQPDFDATCLIMSLPHRFKTNPETIPANVPYLAALKRAEPPAPSPSSSNSGPRIGLVWAGTPRNSRDQWRSCARENYTRLLEVPGASFQSLQLGWLAKAGEAAWSTVEPLDPAITDYADTAAIIDTLDLVISVDTSIAHLAGALGKPVWLLLGRHADWRWLLDRDDTPWYPDMRLFRMDKEGGWDALLADVARDLQDYVRGWNG